MALFTNCLKKKLNNVRLPCKYMYPSARVLRARSFFLRARFGSCLVKICEDLHGKREYCFIVGVKCLQPSQSVSFFLRREAKDISSG